MPGQPFLQLCLQKLAFLFLFTNKPIRSFIFWYSFFRTIMKCFLQCTFLHHLYLPFLALFALLMAGCSASVAFNPAKKYGPDQLREDFTVARHSYEKIHPSLYWFTPKDSMDFYFDQTYNNLTDSLTELQFRNRMAYVIAKIKCGHTSVRFSKAYTSWAEKAGIGINFPFAVKTWGGDSMVITRNAFRKDSLLTAGTVLLSVNGKSVPQLLAGMCDLISTDGNSMNFKYQLISGNFPAWYRYAYGLQRDYKVQYVAANGSVQTKVLRNYDPRADTAERRPHAPLQAPPSRKRKKTTALLFSRNLVIDSSGQMAVMTLNTFSKAKLKRFFRQSFRTLKEREIPNLVIELRNNGGGSIGNSNQLTRYITDHSFKVADTCAAISFKYPYPGKVKNGFWYKLEHWFVSPFRRKDGRYHFRQLETKVYKPYQKNHYMRLLRDDAAARVAEQRLGALGPDVDADDVVQPSCLLSAPASCSTLIESSEFAIADRLVPVLQRVVVRDDAVATSRARATAGRSRSGSSTGRGARRGRPAPCGRR